MEKLFLTLYYNLFNIVNVKMTTRCLFNIRAVDFSVFLRVDM